jgi:hypothetical protein
MILAWNGKNLELVQELLGDLPGRTSHRPDNPDELAAEGAT